MLPVSIPNVYFNMEYNNEHHKLLTNGKISTLNNSSVSTFTSPSVTSTNDKGCSLFSPRHEKIKYSYFSNTKSIYVKRSSDLMKSWIKLLAHKLCHFVIIEHLFKDKAMKKVLSVMDIINTSSTQEIISRNKCQMRFWGKLELKNMFIMN